MVLLLNYKTGSELASTKIPLLWYFDLPPTLIQCGMFKMKLAVTYSEQNGL